MVSVIIPLGASGPVLRKSVRDAAIRLLPVGVQRPSRCRWDGALWAQIEFRPRGSHEVRAGLERQTAQRSPDEIKEPSAYLAVVDRELLQETRKIGACRQSGKCSAARIADQDL
jgi:hypothetical protein